jgi:hypothetical protein
MLPSPAGGLPGGGYETPVELTIGPLPRYEWGLELAGLIEAQVTGVVEVERLGYADRRLRLRLSFDGPPGLLPARLEALRWRDFTLLVLPRSDTDLEVRLQRF